MMRLLSRYTRPISAVLAWCLACSSLVNVSAVVPHPGRKSTDKRAPHAQTLVTKHRVFCAVGLVAGVYLAYRCGAGSCCVEFGKGFWSGCIDGWSALVSCVRDQETSGVQLHDVSDQQDPSAPEDDCALLVNVDDVIAEDLLPDSDDVDGSGSDVDYEEFYDPDDTS